LTRWPHFNDLTNSKVHIVAATGVADAVTQGIREFRWLLLSKMLEMGILPSRSFQIFISLSDIDKAFSDTSTWQPPSRVCSPSPARVAVSDRHVGMSGWAFAIGCSATADANFVFGDLDTVRCQSCSHFICSQFPLQLSPPGPACWTPV
jgi:hypothetical protein